MVIFFSSITAVCFHLGIIQLIIEKPSVIAMKFMKTTGPETINAMANIFLSMVSKNGLFGFFWVELKKAPSDQ